jgi:hypothetical protein
MSPTSCCGPDVGDIPEVLAAASTRVIVDLKL